MKHQFKFMPMYWLDYHIDTEHLSTVEHGAYLMLISYYWRSGEPIPDNDVLLSKVTKLSLDEWKAIKATVLRFFEWVEGSWQHKRIEREFANSRSISEKNSAAVNKRWAKRDGVVVQMSEIKR